MGIGWTIIFFLHSLIGIKPMFSVDYSATGTSYFLGLTTTNMYIDAGNIRLIRYSGFFDEPGTFALYSFFAIILNRIYFKNKKIELWLITVTMFTLSLAFYLIIFVFFLFFYLNKSNLKFLFIILLTIGISYSYLISNEDNETLGKFYDFTFKRFEMDETGLSKNNRAEASEHDKVVFFKYPIFGAGSSTKEVYGSNLFSILAEFGIIGSLFYYAFLVYFFILTIKMKKDYRNFYLKILFLILLNFYHRPEMSSVFALLVFVSIIYYIRNDSMLLESAEKNGENRIKLA